MDYIDYSYLIKRFNNDLVDKLRGHGEDDEVLSLWVPNENILNSLSNFLSALKESKVSKYFLKISNGLISEFEVEQLKKSQIGFFKLNSKFLRTISI